jgi:defect-in-organelle-trafficking protein DotA
MQYALEDQRHKYNKDHGDNPDNTPVLLTPDFDQSSPTSTGTISFPGSFNDRTLLDYVNTGSKPLPDPKGNCGTYVWTNVPPLPSIGTGTPDKNGPTDYQNAKKVSAQQMVYELDGIAQLIAQTSDNTDVKEIVNPSILDQTDFQNEVMTTLVSTAADYQAYVYPFMVYANNGYSTTTNTPNSPVYEEIDTSKGWVNAGSYYFALIQLHDANAQKGAVGGTFTIVSIKGGIDTGSVTPPYYPLQGISDPLDQLVYPYFGGNSNRIANMKATLPWITDPEEPASLTLATNLNNANIGATTAVPLPEELKSLITGGQFNITLPAIQQNKTPLWGAWSSAMTTVANTMYNIASGVVLTPVNESINKVTKDWYNIFFNPSGNTKQSPFIGLQIFGNTLITESLNIWQTIFENLTMITTQYYFATTVIITATNAVTAVIDSLFGFGLGVQQLANQVQTAAGQFFHMFFEIPILIVMPIALAVCTIFLTMGITFSYYLPLVPFMLFLFGTLTWLMTVIEAMAAAPVIALAISAPEGGHDVLGKAEQAVGLIFSVFLRPVCLIMGLIAAIVLTYVALNVLNTTFGSIINSLFYANPQSNLYFQPSKPGEYSTSAIMEIGSAAMIIVYLMIVLALYNQCCTLIYTLVNKILQYVNIHPPTGAEEAMVREVKAGMEGYAKDMAGAGIQQGLGAAKPTFGTTAVGLKLPSVKEAVSEVGAAAAGAPPGATGGVGGK